MIWLYVLIGIFLIFNLLFCFILMRMASILDRMEEKKKAKLEKIKKI